MSDVDGITRSENGVEGVGMIEVGVVCGVVVQAWGLNL